MQIEQMESDKEHESSSYLANSHTHIFETIKLDGLLEKAKHRKTNKRTKPKASPSLRMEIVIVFIFEFIIF